MTTSTIPTSELALFLADYSARLLGSGATCIRLEMNVRRMAAAYGCHADVTILPRHIQVDVNPLDHSAGTRSQATVPVPPGPVSYNINTRLSALSWKIADRRLPLTTARRLYRTIICNDPQNPLLVLVLVSLANASFCRLFGGDAMAMLVVGAATLAGYRLKTVLLSRGVDMRLTVMICAFVSAVLGTTDGLFSLGDTPGVALGTSVLYLVPGIPFLNSFSDMLYRHYICAFSRFCDAIVLTACLSAGLCGAMLLMKTPMF